MGERPSLLGWLSPPPPAAAGGLDETRRSRLIVYFGFLSAIFGTLYIAFYLLIGHVWGAAIIAACVSLFLLFSHLQPRHIRPAVAANLLAGTMTLGFTGLARIEGGLLGHAIAWIMTIPLIALLLCGERAATAWLVACLAVFFCFVGLELADIEMPLLYSPRWAVAVTVAGYTGVILFLFLVGLIFERGRAAAAEATRRTLGQLEEANRALQRLNQEKSEFLNIAAHDLKGPLGAMSGYAEMIQHGMASGPEETAAWAKQIVASSQHMVQLIASVLSVNAIEEGKMELSLERCDLAEVAGQVVHLYKRAAERKEIPLRWHPPQAPAFALADPRLTLQIVDNLVSNAIKYSPGGAGPVVVHLAESSDHWRIEVEDSGPGLSQADQERLFGRFVRLTPRPTGGESSTGLGLSIVKRLAAEMGGTITCRSELGAGSLFSATFPKWRDGGADPVPAQSQA